MIKKISLFFFCLAFLIMFTGCNDVKEEDAQYEIYMLASEAGYTGTYEEWLNSIKGKDGENGKSAYEIALENGFKGTVTEWLTSLEAQDGENGKSAYEIALENGFKGTVTEWLTSLEAQDGIDGISIKSAKINEDGYLVIELSNNESFILGDVVGEDGQPGKDGEDGKDGVNGEMGPSGKDGEDGISIKSAIINEDGYLIIKLSNNETITAGKVLGDNGQDGTSIENVTLTPEGELIITLGGTEINLGNIKGDNGTSIENVTLTPEGELIITLGGIEVNLGNIKGDIGETGNDGKSAYEIYLEYYPEYDKSEKEWLEDLINGELGKNNKHKVTFNYNNGEDNTEVFIDHSYKLVEPEVPHNEDYEFIGWYYNDNLWDFDLYPVLDEMELVAKYEKFYKINELISTDENINYRLKATVVAIYDSKVILEDETGHIVLSIDNCNIGDEVYITLSSKLYVLTYKVIGHKELVRNPILVNSSNYSELIEKGACVKITGVLELIQISSQYLLKNEINERGTILYSSVEASIIGLENGKTVTLIGYFVRGGLVVVDVQ